jgi:hypothetical protein
MPAADVGADSPRPERRVAGRPRKHGYWKGFMYNSSHYTFAQRGAGGVKRDGIIGRGLRGYKIQRPQLGRILWEQKFTIATRPHMTKGPLGFHGGGKKKPTLVDSWETKSPGKTIIYTIKMTPSRTAYVYECLVVEKSQRRLKNFLSL